MILQVPLGLGVSASISIEYQPQEVTWPYGGRGTMQARAQGLSDFTGSATKGRQPPPVIQSDMATLVNAGNET